MWKATKEQLNDKYKKHYRKKKAEALSKWITFWVPVTWDLNRMSSEFREAYTKLWHDWLKAIYDTMTVRSFSREYRVSPNTCIWFFWVRVRGRKTKVQEDEMNKKKWWDHPGWMNDKEFAIYEQYWHVHLRNDFLEMSLNDFQNTYWFRANVIFNLFWEKYSTGTNSHWYDTWRYVDLTRDRNLKLWWEKNAIANKEYFERQKRENELYQMYWYGCKAINFARHAT